MSKIVEKDHIPKIGIIGGSGYIGSTIACALSETSQIVVIDQAPLRKNPDGRITYRRCDITKYDEVKNALEGLDLVIHTAIIQIPLINENRKLGFEVNFIGTQNICRCIDQSPTLKGMLLTGTWHVFGERGIWG
ncbi:MAG: NAD-dependent epimerase/dehydratase family protein, partial [Ignavibacteriales bacterium]